MKCITWTASCLLALALGAAAPADETATLQARLDALPPGGSLVLEARTYCFQGLRVSRSITLAGQGVGRTRCVRTAARPFFQIRGRGTEATVQQMSLEGGGLAAAGIEASGIRTLRLSDLRVAHCGLPPPGSLASDRLGKPIDGVYAQDVDRAEVFQCTFEANARDGFIGIPVRHLFFTRNVCRGNGRMGCTSDVDPEGRTGGPLQAVYRDNEVLDCGTGGLHVESDKNLPVAEALFEGNRVTGCGDRDWGYSWGLVIGLNAKGTLRNNTVTGIGLKSGLQAYRNGILVARPGGPVLIEGNTVRETGRSGISASESSFAVTLRGNKVTGSRTSGISLYMIPDLRVEGCTVEGAGQWGLWCRMCASGLLQGNTFKGNGLETPGKYAAVRAEASAGLRLKDNDLGGPPQALGLELELKALGLLTHLEGNTFEGKRSHPRLSSFQTSN